MILIKLVFSPTGGREQIFIFFSKRQSGVAAAIFPISEEHFVRAQHLLLWFHLWFADRQVRERSILFIFFFKVWISKRKRCGIPLRSQLADVDGDTFKPKETITGATHKLRISSAETQATKHPTRLTNPPLDLFSFISRIVFCRCRCSRWYRLLRVAFSLFRRALCRFGESVQSGYSSLCVRIEMKVAYHATEKERQREREGGRDSATLLCAVYSK